MSRCLWRGCLLVTNLTPGILYEVFAYPILSLSLSLSPLIFGVCRVLDRKEIFPVSKKSAVISSPGCERWLAGRNEAFLPLRLFTSERQRRWTLTYFYPLTCKITLWYSQTCRSGARERRNERKIKPEYVSRSWKRKKNLLGQEMSRMLIYWLLSFDYFFPYRSQNEQKLPFPHSNYVYHTVFLNSRVLPLCVHAAIWFMYEVFYF